MLGEAVITNNFGQAFRAATICVALIEKQVWQVTRIEPRS